MARIAMVHGRSDKMPRRYFNWKLASVCVIALVVLGITAFGLRKWQRGRMAYGALDKGNKAYEKCLWEEAAVNLGRYLAVARDDVPVLIKYADAQLNIRPLKRGNVQQTIAAYRTILRIDKNNTEAALKLVEIYLQMGMPGEAELIASRAIETSQSQELRRMLAVALINQRKFKEAAKELESAIKEHPEQILAYDILGQMIEQRPEDFSQPSQFWFNEAVKNNPSSALAYIIRAGFYIRSNDKAKALTDLEQAENQDLSDASTRLRLAKEFINANVLEKAEEHIAAAKMIEPANQILWQMWAQLALMQDSKTKMLTIAETGLKELSAQPWDFMPVAAELYIQCDELDRASDYISKLREKDIAPATSIFLEGLIANKKGRSNEAVKCWYQAIQLGGNPGRIRLALAAALSRLGDNQSATKQLRTLVSEQPNLFSARVNLARILSETGNWAEAAEQANSARQISPNSFDASLLYVQAQLQLLIENQPAKDSPIWQDIKGYLDTLESSANGALEVKLLQFRLAIQQGNFAGAEALITELKKAHPSQINVAIAEVELLAATEKEDEAVLMLNKIIEGFPGEPKPAEYLSILLARRDERENCVGVVKDALARIEQPPTQRKFCLLLADLYDRWGQQEQEYELLNQFAQKLPNDILIKRRLLRCVQVIRDAEKAQQLVDDIKSLEGEDGWQWRYEQAQVWFAQDNLDSRKAGSLKDQHPQAISLLKENLLANPDDQASRVLLAHGYEQAGQLQLAISTYNEALNCSPHDLRIIVPAVAALYKANEYDRADEILRQADNEKLFHPELKKLELQNYLRRGELNSAGDILENLLANDPNNQSIQLSLALLEIRQNRFAEADELLSKLKLADPNSLPVTVAQIEMNIRQNKAAEAISLCDEIVDKSSRAFAYILRARTLASLGQAERAKEDFEHATTIEPNNAEAWTAKSDFYRSFGQPDKAIESIQKAMELAPDNLIIKKRAISLFLSVSSPDIANQGKSILDNAIALNPQDAELGIYKARSLLDEGTAPAIEQATSILEKLAEEQPKTTDVWGLLAEIALRQGQPTKAMDITLRGLVHRPNDKSLLLLKARSEAIRSPVLAIPTLKALQELEPNDADVAIYLSDTYLAAGESEKAVNLLKTQLTSRNSITEKRKVSIAFAIALYKNDNKAEAEKEFDSLYQSAPDDPGPLLAQVRLLKDDQLWNQLSQLVLQWYQNHPKDTHTPITVAGDLAAIEESQPRETAENILRKILENDSNCTEAMSVLAMLLQTTDRFTESATLYQQILTLQPDNVIAMNNLAWIMCEKQNKHQQALELTQKALMIAPQYIDLIDTRGVAYYRLGEFDKAIQDFTTCINLYPSSTPPYVASSFHLGRAYAGLKQTDTAIKHLNHALDLDSQIGGLSTAELTEVQRLIEELSQGG
jgi:tetratricopeptide (TPR) repeat protein